MYEEEEEDYGYSGHMRQASLELNVAEASSPRGGNNGALHGVREGGGVGRVSCVTAQCPVVISAVDQLKASSVHANRLTICTCVESFALEC